MKTNETIARRQFLKETALLGAAAGIAPNLLSAESGASPFKGGKIRVGEIGCGSVSGSYLPNLMKQPFIEVVSVCDIKIERAKKRAEQYKVPNVYPNIDEMLAGVPFDLLVNTTSMPSHFPVNKKALQAKRHVWSEKPIALTVKDGKRANIHDNVVENNNGMNFAATGNIVHDVPPGTGMFVLASDRNEIHDNKVMGNQSVGVAILSWFVALRDPEGHADPEFDWYPEGNFVHDNEMKDNGKDPVDRAKLIAGLVGIDALSDVTWDGIVDGGKIYGDAGTPDAGVPASEIPSQLLNCFPDDGSTFLNLDLEHNGRAKTQDRSVFECQKPSLSPIKL